MAELTVCQRNTEKMTMADLRSSQIMSLCSSCCRSRQWESFISDHCFFRLDFLACWPFHSYSRP